MLHGDARAGRWPAVRIVRIEFVERSDRKCVVRANMPAKLDEQSEREATNAHHAQNHCTLIFAGAD